VKNEFGLTVMNSAQHVFDGAYHVR